MGIGNIQNMVLRILCVWGWLSLLLVSLQRPRPSLRSGLRNRLPHHIPPLPLLHHNLKPLEIRQPLPLERGLALLGPLARVPLLHSPFLGEGLEDDGGAGGAGEGDGEGREGEVLEGEGLARDGGAGAVDDCLGEG